ncbi:MAG: hypothetical protein M3340_07360 [Actinomycetota bacterium]|nr:hypothetical protein [Actinomycetota bacterium]
MVVVDPEVSRLKVERELELWRENEDTYRRRGWLLLGQRELEVDIGFLGRLPIGGQQVPAMTACVRLDFTNYDLSPPSLEFINPLTGEHAAPQVQALVDTDEGPRDLVVQSHPDTNRPFFCVPGIRQYHDHPQHSGDSWLLHRSGGEGRLATICDRVWRTMARNLLGIHVELQSLPGRVQLQLRVVNAPGEVAPTLWAQADAAAPAARRGGEGPVMAQAAVGNVPPGFAPGAGR